MKKKPAKAPKQKRSEPLSPGALQEHLDVIDGIKRNPLTEMMTRVEFNRGTKYHRVLRVWSIAKEGDCGPDHRVLDVLGSQRNPNDVVAHVNQMMAKLGPDVVAAYELLSPAGHGFVHYPDWK